MRQPYTPPSTSKRADEFGQVCHHFLGLFVASSYLRHQHTFVVAQVLQLSKYRLFGIIHLCIERAQPATRLQIGNTKGIFRWCPGVWTGRVISQHAANEHNIIEMDYGDKVPNSKAYIRPSIVLTKPVRIVRNNSYTKYCPPAAHNISWLSDFEDFGLFLSNAFLLTLIGYLLKLSYHWTTLPIWFTMVSANNMEISTWSLYSPRKPKIR